MNIYTNNKDQIASIVNKAIAESMTHSANGRILTQGRFTIDGAQVGILLGNSAYPAIFRVWHSELGQWGGKFSGVEIGKLWQELNGQLDYYAHCAA